MYTADEEGVWQRLYQTQSPLWRRFACKEFLLIQEKIPASSLYSLKPLADFARDSASFRFELRKELSPSLFSFFHPLSQRIFYLSSKIRPKVGPTYACQRDLFGDLFGLGLLLCHKPYADFVASLAHLAFEAVSYTETFSSKKERYTVLRSLLEAVSRFFAATAAYGLISQSNYMRAYGSLLLSDYKLLPFATDSSSAYRVPFQLEWALHQSHPLPPQRNLFFVISDLAQLSLEMQRFRALMLSGALNALYPPPQAWQRSEVRKIKEFVVN